MAVNPEQQGRAEQQVRATRAKAEVTRYLNEQPSYVTSVKLRADLRALIDELDYSEDAFSQVLRLMAHNGFIWQGKMPPEEGSKAIINIYASSASKVPDEIMALQDELSGAHMGRTNRPPKKYKKHHPVAPVQPTQVAQAKPTSTSPSSLTVDIVKSTGRVRLSFQGLTIEIGVVEG